MIDRNIENGIIESTFLGIEDHGIFCFSLGFEINQGSGGTGMRDVESYGLGVIKEIFKVLDVRKWEDLKGKHIRIDHDSIVTYGIGHIIKDQWLYFDEFWKEHHPESE